MPWMFIFASIFLVIGLAGLAAAVTLHGEEAFGSAATAIVAGGLGLLLLAWSFTTVVSTRNVGIVTSFGKPISTMQNGLHVKAPWHHVTELDGTIQTDSQIGAFNSDGKCSNGTPVRLANNSTACVDNTIRWRIDPGAADLLFRDYLTMENIRESLVTRELNAALNQVFAAYNPLAPDAAAGPNLTDLANRTTTVLRTVVGRQIEVQNVIISIIHFDSQTQDKINQYQAAIANTHIAQQNQQTATAEAQTNRILADSVSNAPNVLVSKCMDLLAAGKVLPIGMSCWPGGTVPVTIPAR